ncbi:hypothetical protein ACFLVN_03335 [Chloroflexota bacterium]
MSENKPFWTTLPGVLTGIAVVISIVGGLIGGLHAAGIISRDTTGDGPLKKVPLTIGVKGGGTTSPKPGTSYYNKYEQATITAYPDDGWEFEEWVGDYSGYSPTIKVIMDSDKKVMAYFVKPAVEPEYVLTTHVDEGGSISPSIGTYDAAAKVTLTAEAASGWEFDRWSGTDNDDVNPTTVTMHSDKTVTAYFKQTKVTLHYEWSAVTTDYPFVDERVRAVVCLALNEELISKMASSEFNTSIELRPKEELANGVYNPNQANQLLTEVGYPDGFGATVTVADDKVLMFIANVMKNQLGIVGINLNFGFQPSGQEDMVIQRILR